MAVAIRRTTVTPTEGGNVVQLHISDAPLEEPFEAIEIQMTVCLPEFERAILVPEAQRGAMKRAQRALTALLQETLGEIHQTGLVDLKGESG
jgi:hypothetical protein